MSSATARASRLAAHARLVDNQLKPKASASLIEMVEHLLAKRSSHLAVVATIDGELNRVYDRLSKDRPAAVPELPAPQPEVAAPAPAVVAADPTPRRAAAVIEQAPEVSDVVAACDAIVAALEQQTVPVALGIVREACAGFSDGTIKRALGRLVDSKRVVRTGQTKAVRYQLAQEPTKARRSTKAEPQAKPSSGTRVIDGVEYETAWTPHRDAPSLLGDRVTKEASL